MSNENDTLEFHDANHINLGKDRCWADDSIRTGKMRFSWREQSLEDIKAGHWERIKENVTSNGGSRSKATQMVNALRRITGAGDKTIWITFHDGKLWWGTLTGPVEEDETSRYRLVEGGWKCKTFDGKRELLKSDLRKELTHGRRATVSAVKERFVLHSVLNNTPLPPGTFFPSWAPFYEAFADKLLEYQENRGDLLTALDHVKKDPTVGKLLKYLKDGKDNDQEIALADMDPFTLIGSFNRKVTNANRKKIAALWAGELGMTQQMDENVEFGGIPVLDAKKSMFVAFAKTRADGDIDGLWRVLTTGIAFADNDTPETRRDFAEAFDAAQGQWGVRWNLTCGLYWVRPWTFATLDSRSREYLEDQLKVEIDRNGTNKCCSGEDYLKLLDRLQTRFEEDSWPAHSFPELSLAAWKYDPEKNEGGGDDNGEAGPEVTSNQPSMPPEAYTIDTILNDGCFLKRDALEEMVRRAKQKRNLILQGPPGTGKTWLAKKLGYALMGTKDEKRLRAVQFHPNLSYEDFVRGWRPSGDGKLTLTDGPLLQMVEQAGNEANKDFVLVIEEINRGNPAQIFGEMLTLLEADKRTPTEALELSYRKESNEKVYIPKNLYIIGTMNIADRSLAMVDFALRRRFAFVDLTPQFGKPWEQWLKDQFSMETEFIHQIRQKIEVLNEAITADPQLGSQFCVGHSYLTPSQKPSDDGRWYRDVVNTEIGPLLEEYWFDNIEAAQKAKAELLKEM